MRQAAAASSTVGLAGYDGGKMAEADTIDYLFVMPSASVHRIQEGPDHRVPRALGAGTARLGSKGSARPNVWEQPVRRSSSKSVASGVKRSGARGPAAEAREGNVGRQRVKRSGARGPAPKPGGNVGRQRVKAKRSPRSSGRPEESTAVHGGEA